MKNKIGWCNFHNVSMARCERTSSMSCEPIELTKEKALERAKKQDKSNSRYHLTEEVEEYFK